MTHAADNLVLRGSVGTRKPMSTAIELAREAADDAFKNQITSAVNTEFTNVVSGGKAAQLAVERLEAALKMVMASRAICAPIVERVCGNGK